MKFSAVLSYLGTRYCGWQKQEDTETCRSLQAVLERTLFKISNEVVTVVASGRTDAGVHAVGQVVHFSLENKPWESWVLMNALNALLPRDIRVLQLKLESDQFHAQRDALRKQYGYYFQQGPAPLAHLMPLSWWIRKELDVGKMNQSLEALLGEHDFLPFRAAGSAAKTTVRKIYEAHVKPSSWGCFSEEFTLLKFTIIGSGFLKQMVRGIAGTLLQIGEGRRTPQSMREILDTQDRSLIGPTAPARALWLEKVWYRS